MESEGENDEVPEFRDENEREGEGLLWETGQQTGTPFSTSPVDTFTRIIPPTPSSHHPEASSLAPERPLVAHPSSNESLITHEAASITTADEEDEEADYIPTSEQEALNKESRRISFNASVRISGGIRSKSSRRALLESDLFSPVASTSTHRPRSRRASPQRTLSQSSHPRDASNSSLGPDGQAHSTTTSAFPSRSSSPCSSIYAPLQPSSQTCPSSAIFIRTPTTTDPSKNRSENKVESKIMNIWKGSSSALGGWRDYLLGTTGDGRNGIGEEDAAKAAKGYRDLVEEQRKLRQTGHVRRASGSARRRPSVSRGTTDPINPIVEEGGLLSRVWGLLKSGVVASGRGGRGGMIPTTYGTNLGPGNESRNGTMEQVVEEEGRRSTPHRGQQRTRRSSSTLSISDLVSTEEGAGFASRQNSPTPTSPAVPLITAPPTASYLNLPVFGNPFQSSNDKSNSPPKPKSTADVIFGPAPGRWITKLWVRDVVNRGVREVRARIGRCWNGEEEI